MTLREVNFWYWLVDRLPHKLVYFCFMKVMSHATTGKYSSTITTDITGMEAIERYDNDHNVHGDQ
jgi:hypothetical protein